jgi:PAS domain S-box-containing protein
MNYRDTITGSDAARRGRPGAQNGPAHAPAPLDYKQFFVSAPALFLVLRPDADFTIAEASDAYLRATHMLREAIVGRPLIDVFPDNQEEPGAIRARLLRASLEKVLVGGRADVMAVQKYDIRRPESEGGGIEERYRSPMNSPIFSDTGEMLWIVHCVEDVTELVRTKAALHTREIMQEREDNLRSVIETTPECVKILARDGTILQINPSGLAMVGASCADMVIGKNAYANVAPEHREAFRAFTERVCDGEPGTFEFDLMTLTRGRRQMETHAAPLRMSDGSTAQFCLTRDITERRRAEKALVEADRRKDEFIATLSHELRNPLAPLRNALNLLRLTTQADGKVARVYDVMERQLVHLVRLVDDLLEASRISRGVLELRRERVELASVIQNAVETSSPAIREAGHELVVKLPQKLVWLDGDPVRLAQVFSNLLNNAARFTDSGGRITISAEVSDGRACVSVRDTGRGFAPEVSGRLFEMFTKSDRSNGLGIGLALSRRLAQMHGGDIEARSDGEQRGAEFVVWLPLAASGGEGHVCATDTIEKHAPTARRVLIADDNRDSADLLGELIHQLGSDVALASDGEEAVEVARAFRPDVAVLDVGMPKMDGYEAARRIRSESGGRRLKLVALTGWGQAEDRRLAREAGFDEHLVKPVELAALEALLAWAPS